VATEIRDRHEKSARRRVPDRLLNAASRWEWELAEDGRLPTTIADGHFDDATDLAGDQNSLRRKMLR